MPAPIPVTVPTPSTVPTVVVTLDHVPPAVASLSEVVKPTQTLGTPLIAAGCVFTVTTAVDAQPPNV